MSRRRYIGLNRTASVATYQAVYDNIESGGGTLTSNEKTAIETYLDAETTDGNYDSLDEIQFYAFSDNLCNGRGWFGVGNATLEIDTSGAGSAVTHGWDTTDGYIDTGINATTLTNYAIGDAFVKIWLYDNLTTANNKYLIGNRTNSGTYWVRMRQTSASGVNGLMHNSGDLTGSGSNFADNSDYGISRSPNVSTPSQPYVDYFKDGSSFSSGNSSTVGIPNSNLVLGSLSTDGVESNSYRLEGIYKMFVIGGDCDSFTDSTHHTNKTNFFTNLGL